MMRRRQTKETPLKLVLPPLPEALLDVRQTCSFLHIGKTKLFQMTKQGLPHYNTGGKLLFSKEEVWGYMQTLKVTA